MIDSLKENLNEFIDTVEDHTAKIGSESDVELMHKFALDSSEWITVNLPIQLEKYAKVETLSIMASIISMMLVACLNAVEASGEELIAQEEGLQ